MKKLVFLLLLMTSTLSCARSPVILILGDSLSAAHGIDQSRGWVELLQQRLKQGGYPHQVVNASISGDTTRGGLERLPSALAQFKPDILVIELGANDGLRGQPLGQTRDNLKALTEMGHKAGCRVILMEMRLPPNLGRSYIEKFRQIYHDLAKEEQLPLVPFFLEGVVDRPDRMQEDRLHPNGDGQPRMLENFWPVLERILELEPAL